MLFLKKSLNPFQKSTATFTFFNLHPFSTLVSKTLNPSPKPNLIADYLITSCGLSPHKAALASTQIPRFTSVDQAHSVRHFLEHHGFAEARIRTAISGCPQVLSADVSETLQPNLELLRGMGFSETELQLVVESHPRVLLNPLAVPNLQFWRNFLSSSKRKDRCSAFSTQRAVDIVSGIGLKIAMLRESRYSEIEIIHILKRACSFIALMPAEHGVLSLNRIEWAAFDAKMEFFKGFGWSDAQFLLALEEAPDFIHFPEENIREKMEFFKGFGWSDAQFLLALEEAPDFIHFPEENIREKMEFLVERAGHSHSDIVSNSLLLTLDLGKRLRPRYYVMAVLITKKLVVEELDLPFIMKLSEKNFVNRFILRYKEILPELHDMYVAARAG